MILQSLLLMFYNRLMIDQRSFLEHFMGAKKSTLNVFGKFCHESVLNSIVQCLRNQSVFPS